MIGSLVSEVLMHSPSDIARLFWSFIMTRLFFPNAKIIRRPIAIRGKKNIHIGSGMSTGRNCRLESFGGGIIEFGPSCQIGDCTHIVSSELVTIGEGCLIASKVFISDTSHGSYGLKGSDPRTAPSDRPLVSKSVHIGKNVWIGDNVAILPGSYIGDGVVVGANAVVTGYIADNTIVAGVPARPIKSYSVATHSWQ